MKRFFLFLCGFGLHCRTKDTTVKRINARSALDIHIGFIQCRDCGAIQ